MIPRTEHVDAVLELLQAFPPLPFSGHARSAKTTLAQQVARRYRGPRHRLDLEDPADLNRLWRILPCPQ